MPGSSLSEAASELRDSGVAGVSSSILDPTSTYESASSNAFVLRNRNAQLKIFKLPFELLVEIFLLACLGQNLDALEINPASNLVKNDHSEISRSTRHSIVATCYHWQEVAIASPLLWNRIAIVFKRPKETHYSSVPSSDMISLELERSSEALLRLHLNWEAWSVLQWDVVSKQLDFQRISSRCEVLKLEDKTLRLISQPFMSPHDEPLEYPHLQSLVFTSPKGSCLLDLSRAPRLRHLSLSSMKGLSNFTHVTRLTHLRLSKVYPIADAIGLLTLSPELEVLRLKFSSIGMEDNTPAVPQILLPSLRKLSYISFVAEQGMVFDAIYAPNLIELQIQDCQVLPPVPKFLNLRSLDIQNEGSLSLDVMTNRLLNISSIHYLVAELGRGLPKEFLVLLKQRDESGQFILLPSLREFMFDWTDLNQLEELISVRNTRVSEEGPGVPFVVHFTYGRWPSQTPRSLAFFERHRRFVGEKEYQDTFLINDWDFAHPGYSRRTLWDLSL